MRTQLLNFNMPLNGNIEPVSNLCIYKSLASDVRCLLLSLTFGRVGHKQGQIKKAFILNDMKSVRVTTIWLMNFTLERMGVKLKMMETKKSATFY